MGADFVEIDRLTKTYRSGLVETLVLRGISARFARGSLTAIVGPSGCGKSTLLGILGGLDRAGSGKVCVDGFDLAGASSSALARYRRRVGVVYQSYNLLPSLTALENVEAGLELTDLRARERRGRARDVLERVGLADALERFPAQLSGGQQQRVAVARALAREPALLLADEPTGNLDREAGARVFGAMLALQKEMRVTCVVVTHDAELARRADRVLTMRDGSFVAVEAVDKAPRESGLRLAGSWS